MTDNESKLRDYLTRVSAELRTVKQQAAEAESALHEPIAIVGMGCRFPGGVRGPDDLWDMLESGRDVVGTFPSDRGWDLDDLIDPTGTRPGTSTVDTGSFLDDVASFDCGFFGISPREALSMDPQQRILLETVWEAMENAGIDPTSLRESETGVFLGATDHDYGTDLTGVPPEIEGNAMIGRSGAVSAGRISYTLGLNGPALTVDTMCSSSLVALHLACQALRRDECSMAVTGGTTVLSTPEGYTEFSRQGALASDGRCKSFSDDADGTGWAEGVGVLVVERLSDAVAAGHEVLAVVRGSAINQDGASNGLTAPNARAQRAVIKRALADAGLTGNDVDMVEAHGTGTTLGDPIEAESIIATYGAARAHGDPIRLGSMKSNLGHAAAAAGVGGVIKTVLAMQRGLMPRTLHVRTPTSRVDWSAGTVALLTEARAWPETGRPRRGAVSAFGASGTNAHVVLEQAPPRPERPRSVTERPRVGDGSILQWRITARSENALIGQADAVLSLLHHDADANVSDLAFSLATRRAVLDHRAVVVGRDRTDLVEGLRALVRGASTESVVTGVGGRRQPPVFVFPGQGSQWPTMAVELARESPVFAAGLSRCAEALAPYLDVPLDDILFGPDAAALQERVDLVQPALWAVMVALAEVWRAAGVEPAAVIGHSQGEIAAACVAGALTLSDGAAVVALRSAALRSLADGGMLAVALSRTDAQRVIAGFDPGSVDVAAVNGPRSVVLSGDRATLESIAAQLDADGTRVRMVPVSYASHSAHVDAVRARLARDLAHISPASSTVPLYSTVTAGRLDTAALTADYWFRNLRQSVEFEQTVLAAIVDGMDTFVEISPHPVLLSSLTDILDTAPAGVQYVAASTLRRDDGGLRRLSTAFAEYFAAGGALDWTTLVDGSPIALPNYVFDRSRYWMTGTGPKVKRYENASASGSRSGLGSDSSFWDLVTRGDLGDFTRTLGVGPDADASAILGALDNWRRSAERGSAAAGLRYRIEWEALAASRLPVDAGVWTLLSPYGFETETAALGAAFARLGVETREVFVDLDGLDRRALADVLLADSVARTGRTDAGGGVVSLLALADSQDPRSQEHRSQEHRSQGYRDVPRALAVTALLLQAVSDGAAGAPLWVFTRGSESVLPQDGTPDPSQGAVAALVRVAALEMPDRIAGTVDLPAAIPTSHTAVSPSGRAELEKSAVAAVLGESDGIAEDQLAVRTSGLFGRRLHRVQEAPQPGRAPWRPGGTTLITGGTGGIGRQLARWLADRGAQRLVLVSRRGRDAPDTESLVRELTERDVQVDVVAADVGDRSAMAALRDKYRARAEPVTSIFHIAGAGVLATLADTNPDEFADTTRAKIAGARVLDEVFSGPGGTDVTDFVLFSSISAVWGSGAHGAYASANAYLDTLSQRRRSLGLPSVSIVWGIWDPSESGGMAAALSEDTLRARGIPFMDPEEALTALGVVLDGPSRAVEVLSAVDWDTFVPVFTAARPSALLDALTAETSDGAESSTPAVGATLSEKLLGQDRDQRERTVLALVRTAVAEALALPAGAKIDGDRAFRDLGMDSLTAVDVRKRLAASTSTSLPVTMVFDHPTARALAAYVLERILPPAPDPIPDAVTPVATTTQEPAASQVEGEPESFDDMDVDALVRSALGNRAGT